MGGATGPILFGALVETRDRTTLLYGSLAGAAVMIAAGIVQVIWDVAAEDRTLEEISAPLSAVGT